MAKKAGKRPSVQADVSEAQRLFQRAVRTRNPDAVRELVELARERGFSIDEATALHFVRQQRAADAEEAAEEARISRRPRAKR